jgi:hypothetical protein
MTKLLFNPGKKVGENFTSFPGLHALYSIFSYPSRYYSQLESRHTTDTDIKQPHPSSMQLLKQEREYD